MPARTVAQGARVRPSVCACVRVRVRACAGGGGGGGEQRCFRELQRCQSVVLPLEQSKLTNPGTNMRKLMVLIPIEAHGAVGTDHLPAASIN